jgi:hypothetical protein
MKKLLLFTLVLVLSIRGLAQNATAEIKKIDNENNGEGAVKKGNIIIDGFYGFPNLYKSLFTVLFREAEKNGSYQDVRVNGIGPVGANIQYMIEDKIGLLVEANYLDFGFSWKDNGIVNTNTLYNQKINFSFLRLMAGGEYHGKVSEKLDAYGGAKIGLNIIGVQFKSDDPDLRLVDLSFGGFRKNGIGVASRFYGGIRYFPVKPIGLYIEGGFFGGGIIRGGISIKI